MRPRQVIDTECVTVLRHHKGPVLNVKFTTNGTYCMSTSQDKSVILWNPHKGTAIKEYKGPHNHEVNDVCITSDNARFATCGGDKAAFVWDVTSANVIRKFVGHEGKINCCELAGNDSLLLTGCYDKSLRIFDLKSFNSNKPIQTLTEARDTISSILVTQYHTILTTSVDGCLRCYDVRAGRLFTDKLSGPAVRCGLSQDERCIVVNCLDQTIHLLEIDSGQHLTVFKGHKNSNYSLNPSIDSSNNYVISGSEDGKICVWDICHGESTLQELSFRDATYTNTDESKHDWGCIFTVRFHPRDWMFLTTHNDKTIRLWKQFSEKT